MKSLLIGILNFLPQPISYSSKIFVVEKQLLPYVHMFREEASRHKTYLLIPDITITFGPTYSKEQPARIGYCAFTWPRAVVINPEMFAMMNPQQKEMIMFHELGHCILNRQHDHRCRENYTTACKKPVSLMYDYISATDYVQSRDYYMEELFSKEWE